MLFRLLCVEPGLILLPDYMTTNEARVLLLAIAGQESNWAARAQVMIDGSEPAALGYWQFQQDGVAGVATGVVSGPLLQSVTAILNIQTDVWAALQYNDPLACVVARLCLWNDPLRLPAVGDAAGAWAYYARNWRPGKPDQTRWGTAYATAVAIVEAG
jgi:hypothetical protein